MKRILCSALILVIVCLLVPMSARASQTDLSAPEGAHQGTTLTATVVVAQLNVRRAPRVTSSRLGRVKLGDKVTLTGRTPGATWLQIRFGSGFGWVLTGYVKIDGEKELILDLPVTDVYPPYLTVTAEPSVNVRMGPSELYPVVTRLRSFVDVDVIGVQIRPLWYLIAMPDTGPIGWVRGDTVMVTGPVDTIPERTGIAMARVTSYRVHVRATPLLNAPVVTDVYLDQYYQVVGLDARRNWWQIRTPAGDGWVLAQYVQVFGNILGLPEQMTVALRDQQQ